MKYFLLKTNENEMYFSALDPDQIEYFQANFSNFFCSIALSTDDREEDYISALHDYPADSPADAPAHNTNLIGIFSEKCSWAIYADRDLDVAVCGFIKRDQLAIFKSIFKEILLGSVEDAVDFIYSNTDHKNLKSEFCDNYH